MLKIWGLSEEDYDCGCEFTVDILDANESEINQIANDT
jgi:hypothetical protein